MVAEKEASKYANEMELKLDVAKKHKNNSVINKKYIVTNGKANKTNEVETESLKVPEVDFDDLLPYAGEFGLYQFILFIATAPFYIYGVFVYFTQLFITEVSSQHWCWIPELANLTADERRSIAIPLDENGRYGYSQCRSYSANWTQVLMSDATPDPTWETVPCQNGWEFNKSEIPYETISSELGWVCEKSSYQASAQSIFFFGSVFGGFLIGWLADKYGRLPAIVVSNLIGCIGGVVSIFARDFTEFAACRFFMGMSYDSSMMITYLLVLEYIAPRYRTMISNLSFALFYSLGAVALPWIALACGHWKTTSLATSLPLALAILTPFILLESPRWLLTRGRIDDAVNKLLTIGRINKKEVPPKLIQEFKDSVLIQKKDQDSINVLEILRNPELRKMFLLICLEFMCCVIVFDALVRSLGILDFDFFVSFSVVSFTEFPSILIVAFVMDWMGRRWMIAIMSTMACLFSVTTAFIKGGVPSLICTVIARFSINMSYNAAMQWGAELLPTSVRASGIAIIHITGNVATMISPYIAYLEVYVTWLPLALTGCVAGVGAIVALTLPETAKKDMPQTFEDAKTLARSQKFFQMPCFPKKEKNEIYGTNNFSFEP